MWCFLCFSITWFFFVFYANILYHLYQKQNFRLKQRGNWLFPLKLSPYPNGSKIDYLNNRAFHLRFLSSNWVRTCNRIWKDWLIYACVRSFFVIIAKLMQLTWRRLPNTRKQLQEDFSQIEELLISLDRDGSTQLEADELAGPSYIKVPFRVTS